MIKAGRARMRRRTALALPCVEADVVVITAGGKKRSLTTITLREFKAEHVTVEPNRPFQVSDFQMYMTNANVWMQWFHRLVVVMSIRALVSRSSLPLSKPLLSFYPIPRPRIQNSTPREKHPEIHLVCKDRDFHTSRFTKSRFNNPHSAFLLLQLHALRSFATTSSVKRESRRFPGGSPRTVLSPTLDFVATAQQNGIPNRGAVPLQELEQDQRIAASAAQVRRLGKGNGRSIYDQVHISE